MHPWLAPTIPCQPPGSQAVCMFGHFGPPHQPLGQNPSRHDTISSLLKDLLGFTGNISELVPLQTALSLFLSNFSHSVFPLNFQVWVSVSFRLYGTHIRFSRWFSWNSHLTWGRRATPLPHPHGERCPYANNSSREMQTPRFPTSQSVLDILLQSVDGYLIVTGLQMHGIDTFPNELFSDIRWPAVFDSTYISVRRLLTVTSNVLENI